MNTVTVVCRECNGSGNDPAEPHLCCQFCLGQMHLAINRTEDGSIPEGFTEWLPPAMPAAPSNPLVLYWTVHPRCAP